MLPVLMRAGNVSSQSDRQLTGSSFTPIRIMEFRLSTSTVNLIVTNYIFTKLFLKIKIHYPRIFSCFI